MIGRDSGAYGQLGKIKRVYVSSICYEPLEIFIREIGLQNEYRYLVKQQVRVEVGRKVCAGDLLFESTVRVLFNQSVVLQNRQYRVRGRSKPQVIEKNIRLRIAKVEC